MCPVPTVEHREATEGRGELVRNITHTQSKARAMETRFVAVRGWEEAAPLKGVSSWVLNVLESAMLLHKSKNRLHCPPEAGEFCLERPQREWRTCQMLTTDPGQAQQEHQR